DFHLAIYFSLLFELFEQNGKKIKAKNNAEKQNKRAPAGPVNRRRPRPVETREKARGVKQSEREASGSLELCPGGFWWSFGAEVSVKLEAR
ncbi:hypothetical protein SUGI_0294890, partial [Cryptomeria japonica]